MKKTFQTISIAAIGIMMVACSQSTSKSGETEGVPGIDTAAMDLSISPKEDFYQYANGGWIKANPLKPEYGRYGTFDLLRDSALSATHKIITSLIGDACSDDEYKAALLYQLVMDSTKLNRQGNQPIQEDLSRIDEISGKGALVDYLAQEGNYGNSTLFGTYVLSDNMDSDKNLLALYQPELIMGDIDYYKDDESYKAFQEGYLNYIKELFVLSGTSEEDATKLAQTVYNTEKSLSQILYDKIERRDPNKTYNKMGTNEFFSSFSFPWRTYFGERNGLNGTFDAINVSEKGFFQKFDKWYATTPLEDIKALIKAKFINDAAPYLSDDYRKAAFNFHGQLMSGLKEMQPRWKAAVDMVNGTFGDVIGQLYTKEYFPPEAKQKMITLIDNLKSALSSRISSLTWMSDSTKQKAQEKLETFHVKVGYPDKWEDYSGLQEDTTSLYSYIKNISLYQTNKNIADLQKPVDKSKWLMNVYEVNAYYNPPTNEITFPAGILQPPFFNMNADDAVNYGAIGVVIGHEMTHGFDDQGSKFDKDGNMENWWTDDDRAKFEVSTQRLAEQFSKIIVADTVHANGYLTLGENIADQGGLLVAHAAMRQAVKDTTTRIDNLTPDQRFFIAYARLWGQNIRHEEILRLTKMDEHSLGKWRVNQALRNIPAFYHAFDIKEGDAMYLAPEKRVLVW